MEAGCGRASAAVTVPFVGTLLIPDSVVAVTKTPHVTTIATRDDRNRPSLCLVGFVRIEDDREHVTCFVTERPGGDTRTMLTASRRVALSMGNPATNENYQLKGTVTDLRAMTDAERAHQDALHSQLADLFAMMFPPELVAMARRSSYRPAVAATIRVDSIFVQTPGPGAGASITAAEGAGATAPRAEGDPR